jgi:hypothetical protein
MPHSKCLRVIGQSLEVAGVGAFEVENNGQSYTVRTASISQAGAWILRNYFNDNSLTQRKDSQSTGSLSLRFTPADILRLEAQAQKKRRNHSSAEMQRSAKLSQLLRTLGDHLDRTQARMFHICWLPDSVSVDYQESDGESDSRNFTPDKLQQLGLHSRFRRSHR